MTRCARCRRKLTAPPVLVAGMPLGPVCANAVIGAKPKRQRKAEPVRDERTPDLFAEVPA